MGKNKTKRWKKMILSGLSILKNIPQLFISLFYRDKVILNAYMNIWCGKIYHNNWGDDLNYYFIQNITNKKIIVYSNSKVSNLSGKINYLCIGSTISWLTNSKTVIWGGGIISDEIKILTNYPYKVLAVRGPLTRKYLLDRDIECPEVYGDPALLLPYFYKPKVNKKYKVGIIPHIADKENIYVHNFISNYGNDVKLIDIVNYINWYDVINEICECEFIISSSLHGIIVSDAYNIPNLWIELSNKIIGNRFKYKDYYMSVNKSVITPYIIDKEIDMSIILALKNTWYPPIIDLDGLIKSCPFKIQHLLKQ